MIIPNMNKQLVHNVAIYLRLSKDDGDTEESESISNQRKIILDYLKKNLKYDNYYEYIDDGFSGATFERPAFKKMISELKEKEIDLVITKNLARFARNYIEAGEYIEKIFPNNNIRYIAILDDVDNFEDRISNEFAPIKGVFNELFCKETSKSVKRSKRKKMHEGFYSCNVAPYGYKKDLDNPGKLIIDKDSSKVVKEIFTLTLNGKTAKQIADLFNEKGIITPAEYLKVRGIENRTKKIWTRSIVSRILSNEVYTGKCLRGKTQKISYKSNKRICIRRGEQIITKNTHEPIISVETYNSVHDNNKYGITKKEAKSFNIKFLQYMYCGYCKEKMRGKKVRNIINIYCPYREETDFICSNNTLYKYKQIEIKIIENIRKEFDKYFKRNNINSTLIKKYNEIKINQIDSKLKELNKELGIIRFKISKLYNDRLQENISNDSYIKSYNLLTETRKELNNQIETLEDKKKIINNEDDNIQKIGDIKKILENLDKDTLTNEDISELIERIEIYEDSIQIFYKFETMKAEKNSCQN